MGRRRPRAVWGLPNYGVEGPDGSPVVAEPQRGLKIWIANQGTRGLGSR